ncbi:hypothetical protein RJT34_16244 [Clitoria ternatea]|uniref:CCHC-type domain-containing protein n=1 Tax=Clitoria ternatea TaxID=43366 RepID=A0AAN9J9V4_CLITE
MQHHNVNRLPMARGQINEKSTGNLCYLFPQVASKFRLEQLVEMPHFHGGRQWHGGTTFKQDLLKMGYTPCKVVFDRRLQRFREVKPEIAAWIDEIPKEQWSMAYDVEGRRFGHMTTNLAECVNKVFRGARNMPITTLVKCTYSRLVEYFVQRGARARAEFGEGMRYTKRLIDALTKNQTSASTHSVRRYDVYDTRFEVEEGFDPVEQRGGRKYTVVLSEKPSCDYGKFQVYHYPCSHVIAACQVVSIDYFQFIHLVYTIDNIINAYSSRWFPLGNDDDMPVTDHGWVLTPDYGRIRPKGRPKSSRIRNEMDCVESQTSQPRCTKCGKEGHNRRCCPTNASGSTS